MAHTITAVTTHQNGNPSCDTYVVWLSNGRSIIVPARQVGYPFHYGPATFVGARIWQDTLFVDYTDGVNFSSLQTFVGSDSL